MRIKDCSLGLSANQLTVFFLILNQHQSPATNQLPATVKRKLLSMHRLPSIEVPPPAGLAIELSQPRAVVAAAPHHAQNTSSRHGEADVVAAIGEDLRHLKISDESGDFGWIVTTIQSDSNSFASYEQKKTTREK